MPFSSAHRIIKNTAMLYIRMLFMMVVSLFTVRVVLRVLGVENYGIYNVVSGVVSMATFLSAAMATATGRFLTFELERKNEIRFAQIFSMSLTIYLGMACLFVILAETIGLWFVNTHLTISAERLSAANWAYQFSIGAFVVSLLTIPYQSAIIAHERMNLYAYIGVVEGIAKLVIVYILLWFSIDKLKLYAFLMFLVTVGVSLIPLIYSIRQLKGCRYFFYWEKRLFNTLISYSGWNLFGSFAVVARGQGVNILLNIFFGPVVNASRAVAFQISNLINNFVTNFTVAANPQIIKNYSAGNSEGMLNLVFHSARYCYYLVLLFSLPVLMRTELFLALWLKNPPAHVAAFTQLVIINGLIDVLSVPLITAVQATGRIKRYQVVVGSLVIFNLPVSYVVLKAGFPPEATFGVSIVISCVCLWLRLFLIRRQVPLLSVMSFFKKVLLPIFWTTLLACLLPVAVLLCTDVERIGNLVIISGISLISSIVTIYIVGMNPEERNFVKNLIQTRLLKRGV